MIVTPGGPETSKLVSTKVLDALGPEGYVVNIARGSVIDEPVLLRYLQEKRIAGAGLDVFADEPRVPSEFFSLDTRFVSARRQRDSRNAQGHGRSADREPAATLRWPAGSRESDVEAFRVSDYSRLTVHLGE